MTTETKITEGNITESPDNRTKQHEAALAEIVG
jgi:hypothetical protein